MPVDLKNNIPIFHRTLPNGMQVVLSQTQNIPVVSLHISFKVGSRNDAPDKTGYAHLFEHLMFGGSKNLPKGKFNMLCSLAGGINNAYTTYDHTSYYMTLPSNQIELGLRLESERLQNLLITQEALDTQKKVVIEEIRQTVEEQPYGKWTGELSKNAFKENTPYFWEVQGSIGHIVNAKLKDVKNYFKRYYNPGNATLVICGDVNHDKIFKLIEKYFSAIPGKVLTNVEIPKYFKKGNSTASFDLNVPSPAVFVAYHCPGFKHKDIYSADILSFIAGTGRSSRLYKNLVYKNQIATQSSSFVDKRELGSLLLFYAIANNTNISCDELYTELQKEISNFKTKSVTEEELTKAKNQLTTEAANELQFSSGIADLLAHYTVFWEEPGMIYSLLDNYQKVNKKDILKFANGILNDANSIRIDAVIKK